MRTLRILKLFKVFAFRKWIFLRHQPREFAPRLTAGHRQALDQPTECSKLKNKDFVVIFKPLYFLSVGSSNLSSVRISIWNVHFRGLVFKVKINVNFNNRAIFRGNRKLATSRRIFRGNRKLVLWLFLVSMVRTGKIKYSHKNDHRGITLSCNIKKIPEMNVSDWGVNAV